MCNALSPEKAVIWTVLHGLVPLDVAGGLSCGLSDEHFTHRVYRRWFAAVSSLRDAGCRIDVSSITEKLRAQGYAMSDSERRALKRLMRNVPPARIRNNVQLIAQALADRHEGHPMHIERLIN